MGEFFGGKQSLLPSLGGPAVLASPPQQQFSASQRGTSDQKSKNQYTSINLFPHRQLCSCPVNDIIQRLLGHFKLKTTNKNSFLFQMTSNSLLKIIGQHLPYCIVKPFLFVLCFALGSCDEHLKVLTFKDIIFCLHISCSLLLFFRYTQDGPSHITGLNYDMHCIVNV